MNKPLIFQQMFSFGGGLAEYVIEINSVGGIYSVSHPIYLAWLAEGNEPLPAEEQQ
jgi:hypothetical protein